MCIDFALISTNLFISLFLTFLGIIFALNNEIKCLGYFMGADTADNIA